MEGGPFQFGHRKDHRPDLPQVKSIVSALDPLGMLVAADVVPDQRTDNPLYLPASARVWEGLEQRGLLHGRPQDVRYEDPGVHPRGRR
jgi:transposase